MELVAHDLKEKEITIACIGDLQWSGDRGPTAQDHLKRYIDEALEKNAYFVGLGDYTDFLSPSNRTRLRSAGLYDTAREVIEDKATELADELYHKYLKPTTDRWLGGVEGHHFFEYEDGTTSDSYLFELLNAPFLGTSGLIKVTYGEFSKVIYLHHGTGGGSTPGAPLNKLGQVAAAWETDVVLMGHTTKTPATRLARIYPVWDEPGNNSLNHKEILLANTGSFCRSSAIGGSWGRIPRGDYAEKAMLQPSPLSAPFVYFKKDGRVTIEI